MSQLVHIASGALDRLAEVLRTWEPRNVLLVTGRGSFTASGAATSVAPLLAPYRVVPFHDFPLDPELRDVERGLDRFRRESIDVIVAIGGGSAIDEAKLIRILAAQEAASLDVVRDSRKVVHRGVPLVAVPTTAGTGSEATHFAGVYVDGQRYSLAHEYVLPDVAIVDPRLTFSMPPRVAASTAMDALCQAVESYWCRNSTEASRDDARSAIRAIVEHVEESVCRGAPESRCAMAVAAHRAGRAINVSKTTAAHAVSYTLTTVFGVPHGHAVALTLGEFLVYNSRVGEDDVNDARGVDHVQRVVAEVASLLGADGPEAARDVLGKLMERIGLATRLRDLGIRSAADLDRIAASVNPARAANNPRRVTREAVREILERVA